MQYTHFHATMSDADLKAASKRDDAELCRLTGEIRATREHKAALDLESFRRRHAEHIDGAVAKIKADPKLRGSLEALRGDEHARAFGPRSYWRPSGWPAWRAITGRDDLRGDQSPSDRKLVEIVLALIPVGSA